MHKYLIILGIAVLLLAVGLSGCTEESELDSDIPKITSHLVSYKVTGSAERVSIYYTNYDGTLSHSSYASLPWQTLLAMSSGDYVSISAKDLGEFGEITVEIIIDREVFKSDTDYGYNAYVSASGRIP